MRNCVIVFAVIAFIALALPASADEVFELVQPIRGYDPTWPPDGSTWHTLHPPDLFCTNGTQTDHDDVDGDGNMSFCDNIQIDGVWKHIEWVGPTIRLRSSQPGRQDLKWVEPVEPTGRQYQYHEVAPVYCNLVETTEPIEYECQEVWIEFPPEDVGWWHVEAIETNIRTNGGSPVERSTWGQIKDWFRSLVD
jgi:hypothetical protein